MVLLITPFISLVELVFFMQDPKWFQPIYVISQVWQTLGWGSILYLAALTNIDDTLYEAAKMDGANRWQQMLHVTLPGILPTIITMLVLNVGSVLGVGFEKFSSFKIRWFTQQEMLFQLTSIE